MEFRETIIERLRKRLGRDPTEDEIKAERDRKWRLALADMGITAEWIGHS
jgi:dephospho-CoA kinase